MCLSLCLSVCLSVAVVIELCKTAERTEVPFGLRTRGGAGNHRFIKPHARWGSLQIPRWKGEFEDKSWWWINWWWVTVISGLPSFKPHSPVKTITRAIWTCRDSSNLVADRFVAGIWAACELIASWTAPDRPNSITLSSSLAGRRPAREPARELDSVMEVVLQQNCSATERERFA